MYQCEVVQTYPRNRFKEAVSRGRCILGISLANPDCEGERLGSLLRWLTANFQDCGLLLGDLLHRHTIECYEGLDPRDANSEAEARGANWLARNSRVLGPHRVQIIRWREVVGKKLFHDCEHRVANAFDRDNTLGKALDQDAAGFVSRRLRDGTLSSDLETAGMAASKAYLLEEAAVYMALAENGWTVDAYPGPETRGLRAMTANARSLKLPKGFESRINVQLRVKEKRGGTQC